MYSALCNPQRGSCPKPYPSRNLRITPRKPMGWRWDRFRWPQADGPQWKQRRRKFYVCGWEWLLEILAFASGMMPGCPHNKHPYIMLCTSVLHTCCSQDRDPRPKIGTAAADANLAQSWGNVCASIRPAARPTLSLGTSRQTFFLPFPGLAFLRTFALPYSCPWARSRQLVNDRQV